MRSGTTDENANRSGAKHVTSIRTTTVVRGGTGNHTAHPTVGSIGTLIEAHESVKSDGVNVV